MTNDIKNVLIIYNILPDDTRIYDLSVTGTVLSKMLHCHGYLGNTAGNSDELESDLDWLNQFLGNKDPVMTIENCPLHSGGTYDAIILTGFML